MSHFQDFRRKSFPVTAARVDPTNIEELAEICGGQIKHDGEKEGQFSRDYIKVRVLYPINDDQTKAHIGDWLVKQGKTWKVYRDSSFRKTFENRDGTPVGGDTQPQKQQPAAPQQSSGPSPASMPKRLEGPRKESVPEQGDKMVGQSHTGVTSETVDVPVVNPEPRALPDTTPPEDVVTEENPTPDTSDGVNFQETVTEAGTPEPVSNVTPEQTPEDAGVAGPELVDIPEGTPLLGHNHRSIESCDANGCETDRYADGTHVFTDKTIVTESGDSRGVLPDEKSVIKEEKKPITLDELNDRVGDPRSTQEIMSEKP